MVVFIDGRPILTRLLPICARAIRLDANDSVAYYTLGSAYCGKNNLDNAIANYTEAIRLSCNVVAGIL